ncbi:TolC family protein [Sulfurovum sp. zt1-1]|uniref:TolC family protein n=1 Tax=Sulfurovum zhangzhouensis TaxID=3019067 RepID=A0ABT7QZC0_9BACT|nr:TolC family protein [Sulfurovum zhangzhouensis]MDM5272143.1 TolC family protein [Sulfurovum zhangzhouensis]
MKKYLILLFTLPLFAGLENLQLQQALELLKNKNLELKVSRFEAQMKEYEAKAATGHHFGQLDVTVQGMRSNDAGNVFGFKLSSREATFGDFGAGEFNPADPNVLSIQPYNLNYPEARNHYQTKFSYMLPLYTGGKLTEYGHITESMHQMSQFDTKQLLNEKIFQTKKAFYDISLVENYIGNLSTILKNITRLENVVSTMKTEGYAQNIDLLEVQARKAEALSLYNQAKLNRELAYQFLSFLLNTEVSSIERISDMAPIPTVDPKELDAKNIDIQKALLGEKIADMAVGLEEANFLPTVGAFAEYGSADNQLFNEFEQKDSYTVGVQLKWNLFSGGTDYANLEKAKVNRMKVQSQVALAKSGIKLKAKKLETEIRGKDADVKSYKKQLLFARKVYENYQGRYQEGMVSISDVLIKQSKELEMLLKLLTVKNDRNTKIFELNSLLNSH